MTDFIHVLTTATSRDDAQQIADALVEQCLAACVQISGPLLSVYRWQGKVDRSEEWLCTIKTRRSLFPAVETRIRQMHSYECPELITLPIDEASADYTTWLNDALSE